MRGMRWGERPGEDTSDNHFTDVTLACAGGKQVKAHKVILSPSSSFLQSLLSIKAGVEEGAKTFKLSKV